MMKPVIIFGTGKLAELIFYFITNDSSRRVAGFTVNRDHLQDNEFLDLPVFVFENILKSCPPDKYDMFIAISHADLNQVRTDKYLEAVSLGYHLISYVSSKAIVWDSLVIGNNSVVMDGCIVQPMAKIGNNTIVCSGVNISHHSIVGDNCFIASQAVLAGDIAIGNNCFVGMNATICEGANVGDNCIIGACSLILKSVPPNTGYVSSATRPCDFPADKLKVMLQPTRKRVKQTI